MTTGNGCGPEDPRYVASEGVTMKVQVLYFEGCPNYPLAVKLVKELVSEFDLPVEVEEVEVKGPEDATRLCFLGSPTVLVDGVDVEPAARERTDFGFCCRTYPGVGGVPSREMLVASLAGDVL